MRTGIIQLKKKKCNSKVRTSSKEIKHKKRNVKPLCYTDDESDVDDTNKNLVVGNKICKAKPLSESVKKTSSSIECREKVNPKISEQRLTMNIETNSFESKRKTKIEEVVNRKPEIKEAVKKKPEIEEVVKKKPEIEEVVKKKPEIEDVVERKEEIEEVVKRKAQHYSPPQELSTTVDSEIEIVQEFLKSKKKICKELPTAEEAEEDLESREDGEDDRCTVIFEEELHTEDVFQEKVVSKKFNEKEITNRKRQRLVKFKRKSMAGRNVLMKFRKAKTKPVEVKGNPQELGDKPAECSNEECLREVCDLVKRLHELLRIIQQLQKELPNNGDLAIHFASVIKSQQENFNKEIRKSQRTIIKCYERLMMTYQDTGKVALEICKRTFLNVEDVANIISRCVIVEVYPENPEKTENCSYRSSCENSEKALHRKPIRVTVGSSANQQAPLYPCTAESVYRSNREPPDCPRKDVHALLAKKGKPQFGPPRPPPSRPDQFPQNGFLLNLRPANGPSQHPVQCGPVRNPPLHITTQYYRVDFPVVNTIPRSSGFQQNPVPCSRYIPPLAVPSYSVIPNQVLESSRLSAVAGNFRSVPPPYKVHPTRRPQIPVSVDSVKYSNSGGSFVRPVELRETTCRAELNNSAKQVLDPTVPQKLTMRNSRLEAGPVLSPRAEYSVVPETNPRRNPSTAVDVLSRDSTSRKYVCAQNECKNPGVRICKRCRSVIYCSETCQLQHWTMKHKVECYQLMELRG